ncbi:MAG: glycosyltransferase family 2 protein [Hyphomicrobiales bacterium]|nr:glycosyltransferase family 2 protein [Hyphomicrobiales bacterium]
MLQTSQMHRAASAAGGAPSPVPKVSVVLPTRNRAFCLGEAIDSIRAQTMDDWELIVVDDGSEDETGDLVRRYCARDSRIRYVRQPHGGAARALNTGLRLARGDYLHTQDDDDVAYAEMLAKCTAFLDAHKAYWTVSVRVHFRNTGKWERRESSLHLPFFFRISAVRACGGWGEFYAIREDPALLLRARQRGYQEGRMEDTLYEYRWSSESSATQRGSASFVLMQQTVVEKMEQLAHWGLPEVTRHDWPQARLLRFLYFAPRHAFLPSICYAPWQRHVRFDGLLGTPRPRFKHFGTKFVTALFQRRPRFPYTPLWQAWRIMHERLQCLRVPWRWRARLFGDMVRHYFTAPRTPGKV